MTAQQHNAIKKVEAGHEAERFTADQAAREATQLDAVSVFYAVQVKISEGRIDEARAIVAAYRASNQRSNPQ
jgi:hypothetical protein